jgi:hypothetical protein
MEQRTVRKTCKERLRPTPTQERELEAVLWGRRDLYNTAPAVQSCIAGRLFFALL